MDSAEQSLLAELIMSRRLDFNKASRNHQARYGVSVKDEAERMENDAAARWLQTNENRALRKADHRLSDQQAASSAMKLPRRKSLKHRQADLDPCDPHDQLAGVDIRRAPWR
jgi:hypothetical protein